MPSRTWVGFCRPAAGPSSVGTRLEGAVAQQRLPPSRASPIPLTVQPLALQDARYWGLTPLDSVNIWLALTDVPELSGPMEFLAGSHLVSTHPPSIAMGMAIGGRNTLYKGGVTLIHPARFACGGRQRCRPMKPTSPTTCSPAARASTGAPPFRQPSARLSFCPLLPSVFSRCFNRMKRERQQNDRTLADGLPSDLTS